MQVRTRGEDESVLCDVPTVGLDVVGHYDKPNEGQE
jgi:hypothetical protein